MNEGWLTIGIEEEFQIVDSEGELRAHIDTLAGAVDHIGYQLTLIRAPEAEEARSWLRRVVVAGPLAVAVFVLLLVSMDSRWARWTAGVLTLPIEFWAGWPFLSSAATRARVSASAR